MNDTLTVSNFGHADHEGQTTLDPVGLIAVVVLGVAMLLLPRRYAGWPMVFMASFIPSSQRIMIVGMHFDLLRIMVLFATARVLARREYAAICFNALDGCLIAWCISSTLIYTIQQQTFEAFVFRAGGTYDALGIYFTFRCLVRTLEDLQGLILGFVTASIPVAACFLEEFLTGRNMFAFLGGVPEITQIREGRLRCQGAFSNPILAGCFWAAVLPLIAARLFDARKSRLLTLASIGCCLTIIYFCSSSTPIAAVVLALLAACIFPFRRRMQMIRWGLLASVLLLQLLMTNPVYVLVARVGSVDGSTGWYRFLLIDRAIQNLGEWWLFGTRDTAHWARLEGIGLGDLTNQYILEGVRGGILTMLLFAALFVIAFRNVGRLRWEAERRPNRLAEILAWAMGVTLFVHVTSFIGVSYFGQIQMLIWLSLAVTASLSVDRPYRAGLSRPGLVESAKIRADTARV